MAVMMVRACARTSPHGSRRYDEDGFLAGHDYDSKHRERCSVVDAFALAKALGASRAALDSGCSR